MSAIATLTRRFRQDKADKSEPYARGHLYASPEAGETWALFTLPPVEWVSRTAESREESLGGYADRLADLVGHRVWVLATSELFPTGQFSRILKDSYPEALPSFGPLVDDMAACVDRSGARVHRVVFGVRVASHAVSREHLPLLLSEREPVPTRLGNVDSARLTVERVTRIVAADGLNGRPLTEAQTRAVCQSSIRLGLPDGPGEVFASADAYQATTRLTTLHQGRTVESHVQVLRVEEMEDRDGSAMMPWLAWPQTLPFRVTAVACGDIIDSRELIPAAQLAARQNASIDSADTDKGFASRGEVIEGAIRAMEVRNEMKRGSRIEKPRFRGVVKYAVTAPTYDEAVALGDTLQSEAASEINADLTVNFGQLRDYMTFQPGKPWDFTGHVTSQSVACFAAGLPAVSQSAGDASGVLIGAIGDSSDVLIHDPHGRARPNRPKVHVVVGEPGAGKSSLFGLAMDYLTQTGNRVTANDPSGNLGKLATLPHLRADARVIPITSGSYAGIIMPHYLVPEPRRGDYPAEAEYQAAVRQANAERSNLAVDMTVACLPWAIVERDRGDIGSAVEAAVADAGSAYGTHSREIIDRLASQGQRGQELAGMLRARAALGDGRLVFPTTEIDPDALSALVSTAGLTIVTTPGLMVPRPGTPRSAWQREHHNAMPILLGASRFAALSIWADKQPKGHFDDELGISGGLASFGSFLTRAAMDSRKFGASIWFAFQTMTALDALPDDEMDSLVGPRFVMRTSGTTADQVCSRLLGESGQAWRSMLPGLQDGETVTMGWDGKVRCAQVDQGWWRESLRAAVDTTASTAPPKVLGLLGALRA